MSLDTEPDDWVYTPPTQSAANAEPDDWVIQPPTQPSQDGEFWKSVKRQHKEDMAGIEHLYDMGKEIVTQTPDADSAAAYKKKMDLIEQKYPSAIPTFHDINSIGDFGKFAASQAGSMGTMIAEAGATAGIVTGAVMGAAAMPEAVLALGARAGLTEMAAGAGGDALVDAAASQGSRLTAANAAKIFKYAMPAAFAGQAASQQDYDQLTKGVNAPGTAAIAGVIDGALMSNLGIAGTMTKSLAGSLGVKVLGDEVVRPALVDTALKSLGLADAPIKRKIIQGMVEGSAEQAAVMAAMDGVRMIAENHVGANPDLFSKENFNSLKDSAILGGAMGAAFGGVFHAMGAAPKGEDKLNKLMGMTASGAMPKNVKPLDIGSVKAKATVEPTQKEMPFPGGGVGQGGMGVDPDTLDHGGGTQGGSFASGPLSTTVLKPQHDPTEMSKFTGFGLNAEDAAHYSPEELVKFNQEMVKELGPEVMDIPNKSQDIQDTIKETAHKIDDKIEQQRLAGGFIDKDTKLDLAVKPDLAAKTTFEDITKTQDLLDKQAFPVAKKGDWVVSRKSPDSPPMRVARVNDATVSVDSKTKKGQPESFDLEHGQYQIVNPKENAPNKTPPPIPPSHLWREKSFLEGDPSLDDRFIAGLKKNIADAPSDKEIQDAYVLVSDHFVDKPDGMTDDAYRKTLDLDEQMDLDDAREILRRDTEAQANRVSLKTTLERKETIPKRLVEIEKELDKFRKALAVWNKANEPKAKQQRDIPYAHDHQASTTAKDLWLSQAVGKEINAVPYTEEGLALHKQATAQLGRILKEICGDAIGLKVWKRMEDGLTGNPLRGAQFLNMIHVAIRESMPKHRLNETTYHEIWHALEENKFITDAERKLFDDNHDKLKQYMSEDAFLKNKDFDTLMSTAEGRQELRANAFGKMMVEMSKEGKSSVPFVFRQAFMKARNLLQKFGAALKGLGIKSINDFVKNSKEAQLKEFVKGVGEGSKVGKQDTGTLEDMMDRVDDLNKDHRLVRMQKDQIEELNKERDKEAKLHNPSELNIEHIEKSLPKSNARTDTRGNIWHMTKTISSAAYMASRDFFAAQLYDYHRRLKDATSDYLHQYTEKLGAVQQLDKGKRSAILNQMDDVRILGVKAKLGVKGDVSPKGDDLEGLMHWTTKEGEQQWIKSKEDSQHYKTVQDAFQLMHDHKVRALRGTYYRALKSYFKDDQFTPADIDNAMKSIQGAQDLSKLKEQLAATKRFKRGAGTLDLDVKSPAIAKLEKQIVEHAKLVRDYERLGDLRDGLKGFDDMSKVEYVPHTRFGRYGIVVNDLNSPLLYSKDTMKVNEKGEYIPKADGGYEMHKKGEVMLDAQGRKRYEQPAFYTVEEGYAGHFGAKANYNQHQLEKIMQDLKEKYSDTSKYEVVHDAAGPLKDFSDFRKLTPFVLSHNKLMSSIDPRYHNLELLSGLLHSSFNPEDLKGLRDGLSADAIGKKFANQFRKNNNTDGYSRDWDRALHASFSGAAHFLSKTERSGELSALTKGLEGLKDPVLKKWCDNYAKYLGETQEDWQSIRMFNYVWAMGGNLSSGLVQLSTLPTMVYSQMMKYSPNPVKNAMLLSKWFKIALKYYNPAHYRDLDRLVRNKDITQVEADNIKHLEAVGKLQAYAQQEARGERESPQGQVKGQVMSLANKLGYPVYIGEMITRFATGGAAHELFQDPAVIKRADKILAKDERWKAMVENSPDMTKAQHMSKYFMDEAHGVYGKLGRPELYRRSGGALFFPFMTFPHYAIEGMIRALGQGSDGLRQVAALYVALGVTSGLMGSPGAGTIAKLGSAAASQATGSNIDLENSMYEMIYSATGSETAAKSLTYGLGRSLLGIDMSKRIGIPDLPGSNVLYAALGISPTSAAYGVEGSIVNSIFTAFKEGMAGAPIHTVMAAMYPTFAKNISSAFDMQSQGLMSGGKDPRTIITPEEISQKSMILKALGVTSDQIATYKAKYQEALMQTGNKKWSIAFDRVKMQGTAIKADLMRAQQEHDYEAVIELNAKYKELMTGFRDFLKENKIQGSAWVQMNTQIRKMAQQRVTGKLPAAGKSQGQREARAETENAYSPSEGIQ